MLSLLSCVDPLTPRRPDPHFAADADAARALGASVGLIDHDLLLAGDPVGAVRAVPRDLGPAWYRGWMIPSAAYAALAGALAARGTPLVVDAAAYRTAHELPGWYETFANLTPASRWLPGAPNHTPPSESLVDLAAPLGAGAAIVKDYVKSAKHAWATACHIPDLTDTAGLHRVVSAFVAEQGDHLAGGIVLRAFEHFGAGSERAPEARVWWLDGTPVLVGAHPDTPDNHPAPRLDEVAERVTRLPARFVTTDLALRTDGVWRVMEVGDGQVSDLPAHHDSLIPALLHAPSDPRQAGQQD